MTDIQCSTCINVCHVALTIHPESRHIKTSVFPFSSCPKVIPDTLKFYLEMPVMLTLQAYFYISNLQTNRGKFCGILCDNLCMQIINVNKIEHFE